MRIVYNKAGEVSIDQRKSCWFWVIAIKNDEAQQAAKTDFDRVFQTEITDRFMTSIVVDHQSNVKLATVTYSIDEAPEI